MTIALERRSLFLHTPSLQPGDRRESLSRRCFGTASESLSRRISPDVLPDAVLYVGISFSDVLCIFADVFVRREYPRFL
uniref:Uncharacterized protein n=1 Tax=Cucumis melo TaxID=3656 RepID=A0A9I9E546_CUCME